MRRLIGQALRWCGFVLAMPGLLIYDAGERILDGRSPSSSTGDAK